MLKRLFLFAVTGLIFGCSGPTLEPLYESLSSQGISVAPYVMSADEKALLEKVNMGKGIPKDPKRESKILQGIYVDVEVFSSDSKAREAQQKLEARQKKAKAEFEELKKKIMQSPNPERTMKKLRVFEREECLQSGPYVLEIPHYKITLVDGKMGPLAAVKIDEDALKQLKEAFGKVKSD